MSDPVTNAEVEDVLSSIRRLVSEDNRPKPSARSAPRPDDRLVLTPALRVADPPMDDANDDADLSVETAVEDALNEYGKDAEDTFELEADSATQWRDDDAVASDERLEREDGFDADATEDALDTDWIEDEAAAEDIEEDDVAFVQPNADADSFDYNLDRAAETREPVEKAPTPSSLTAKIAALETAIGSIHQEWEPDDAGTDDYSGTDAPAMAWEDDAALDATGRPMRRGTGEGLGSVEEATFADDDADDGDALDFDEDAVDETDIDELDADERRVDEAHVDEPDVAEDDLDEVGDNEFDVDEFDVDEDDIDGVDVDEVDVDEAETASLDAVDTSTAKATSDMERASVPPLKVTVPAPQMSAEPAVEEAAHDIADDSDDAPLRAPERDDWDTGSYASDPGAAELLDEEALRDLVGEIVRSELQGALGERITRNVRKLVRREIHRALTAQELE